MFKLPALLIFFFKCGWMTLEKTVNNVNKMSHYPINPNFSTGCVGMGLFLLLFQLCSSPHTPAAVSQGKTHIVTAVSSCLFFKTNCLFIYLFLERGEGREKEREININVWLPLPCPQPGTWPATQACTLTGNRTSDPFVHRLAFNPLSHSSQCLLFQVKNNKEM